MINSFVEIPEIWTKIVDAISAEAVVRHKPLMHTADFTLRLSTFSNLVQNHFHYVLWRVIFGVPDPFDFLHYCYRCISLEL